MAHAQTAARREARFSESPTTEPHVEGDALTPKALQSPMPSSNHTKQLPIQISQLAQPKTIWTALADKATELEHLITLEGLVAREESRYPGMLRVYDCVEKYTAGTHLATASFADMLMGTLPFPINDEPASLPDCQPIKMLREEHPSSGYSSDCFEEDETSINARTHKLCFTEAQSLLIDCRVVDPYPNMEQPPSQINLVVMLLDISPEVDYFALDSFVSGMKPPLELIKAKFLFYAKRYSLILQFKQLDIAKRFFQRCREKSRNFEVFFGKYFQTSWAIIKSYNRESKMARHYDVQLPIKFFNDEFVGVVVRDLPDQTELRDFESFLKKNGFDRGIEIQQILRFKHTTFCLVILESITRARKLCHWLNNYKLGKSKIKAHLHPETKRQSLMQFEDLVLPTESKYGELPKSEHTSICARFSSVHSDTALFNALQAIEDVRVKDMVAKTKGWHMRMLSPIGNRSSANLSNSPTDVMNSPFLEQVTASKEKVISGNTSLQKMNEVQHAQSKTIKASSSGKPASAKRESGHNSRDHKSREKRKRSYSSDSGSTLSDDSRDAKRTKKGKDRGSRKSPKSFKRRSRSRTRSRSRGRDRDHQRKEKMQESKRDKVRWNHDDQNRKEISNSTRNIKRTEIMVDNTSQSDKEITDPQKNVPPSNPKPVLQQTQTHQSQENSNLQNQNFTTNQENNKKSQCEEEKLLEENQRFSPALTDFLEDPQTLVLDSTHPNVEIVSEEIAAPKIQTQTSKIDAEIIPNEIPSNQKDPMPDPNKTYAANEAALISEGPHIAAEMTNDGDDPAYMPTYTAVKPGVELEWYDQEILPEVDDTQDKQPNHAEENLVKDADHSNNLEALQQPESQLPAIQLDPQVDECVTWFDSHTNHISQPKPSAISAYPAGSAPMVNRSRSKDSKHTPTRDLKADRDKDRERYTDKDRERGRHSQHNHHHHCSRDIQNKGYHPSRNPNSYKNSWDQRRVDSDDRRHSNSYRPYNHKRF